MTGAGRLAASVVRDESETDEVRCAAYRRLLVTRGFSRGTESPEVFLRGRAGLPVPRRRGLGAR